MRLRDWLQVASALAPFASVLTPWRGTLPRLSVVVPVYNVRPYLAECLDSILSQSFQNLEIILVENGSTDGSEEVAKRYRRRFRNVRLVSTRTRGVGAARNAGVRHSRGELLAFVDSDDTVLPEAFASMVQTLDETGSDFVVGTLQRNFGDAPSTPPRQRPLHREQRLAVTAQQFPAMLGDVFACNKVFWRSFWERNALSFPEGIRYEDQETLTRAFLVASSFDVIIRPVYLWRIREDGSSITQRRHEIEDLRDRFQTKRQSLKVVRELGTPHMVNLFYREMLAMDLPSYFRNIPDCSDEYWRLLHRGMSELYADAPSLSLLNIPVEHRVIAWLVTQDRRTDAEKVFDFALRHRPDLPVTIRQGHVVAQLPLWDDPSAGVPPELFRLREREPLAQAARRQIARQ